MKGISIKDFELANTENTLRALLELASIKIGVDIDLNKSWDDLYIEFDEGVIAEMIAKAASNKNSIGYEHGKYIELGGVVMLKSEAKTWELESDYRAC